MSKPDQNTNGCGVVVMEQVTHGSRCDGGGVVLLAVMAAVGALQRGVGGSSVLQRGGGCMEAGTRAGGVGGWGWGTGEWWGQ
jgi:hypothetical protein